MAGSKKKILIANIPLNGARVIETGAVDNSSRSIYFNEESNSFEIEKQGETESATNASAVGFIGTIDYTDINALAASEIVSINFEDKLPENAIPEYLVAVIETPFVMGGAPIVFTADSQIINTLYNTTTLVLPIDWINFQQEAETKIAAKYDVKTFVGKTLAQDIAINFNFTNNEGQPISNPKSLTAGRVKFYTYYRNFTN